MLTRYRMHALLAVLAFACAQGWNRLSLAAMRQSPEAASYVRPGSSIITADDASYLQEAEKLLGNRPDLEQGAAARRPVLRPPGYGWWYVLPRLFLSPEQAIAALVLLQGLLYAFSVALLHEALLAQDVAARIRWPLLVLFAVTPIFHGFLFHTLSEGVTPALTLLVVCASLLAMAGRRHWLLAGCLIWALLMITRPVLAWAGLALLPALRQQLGSPLRIGGALLLCALPTGMWWAANSARAGRLVSLHPVYQPDELGINRCTHAAFWGLAGSWGARGDDFHSAMETAFRAALTGDTTSAHAERFLSLAPEGSLTPAQRVSITGAFRSWQRFTSTQLVGAMQSGSGTLPYSAEERRIVDTLEHVTREWRQEHRFHHLVIVPARVLKQLVAHSNLNLWLFQHHLRGHAIMEVLRWMSAAMHMMLLFCVPLALLLRTPATIRFVAFGACAYLLYLAYVQRGVEERYTLPVLFLGVVCAAFVLASMFNRRSNEPQRRKDAKGNPHRA